MTNLNKINALRLKQQRTGTSFTSPFQQDAGRFARLLTNLGLFARAPLPTPSPAQTNRNVFDI